MNLLSSLQTITEEKDNQDTVVETYRCMQEIVEHWIQQKQIKGVKDKFGEEITFINDVTDCNE